MQVTETSSQGLRREYKITVPADEIATRVNTRLQQVQQTIRMPGFRPGKAPLTLLRKQYGRSVMGEVLEQAVEEGARAAVEDRQLRPALRPKVEVTSFDEGKDLEFQVNLEVLPDVPEVDVGSIELTRYVTEVDDAKIDEALNRLAEARRKFEAPAEARPSQDGDQIVIDFDGRVDGEPFEGGTGKDFTLVLGSNSMVPGFEEQLVGVSPGEQKQVEVTFPEDFGVPALAGKPVSFDVTVKEVKAPQPLAIDEAWAKDLGEESLDAVRQRLRERLEQEYGEFTRLRLKRQLLDKLAERHDFPVPEGMVDAEFEAIWKQYQDEAGREGGAEAAAEPEETARAEYRRIAERRVRLGLLLSDIGNRNQVQVEGPELQQAAMREAMRFPGQERKVLDFLRDNPAALEQLRAPIFEEKVCDLIFGQAKVEERKVPVEELLRDPDDDAEAAPPAASPEAPAETPAQQS